MIGCFTGHRTRRYIDSKQRIEAKSFKPFIKEHSKRFKLDSPDKYPQEFTIKSHSELLTVLWFESEGNENFPVPLVWDNTKYPRLIFLCPCCESKRLYLYGASNGWACRKCLNLHYSVQSMTTEERLRKRIRKLRRLIWGANASMDTFDRSYACGKPRLVRHKQFIDDVVKLNQLEDRYLELVEKRFSKLEVRITELMREVRST
ncbi:hypothetical protein BCU91_16510 [Shewanella sp. 10N.286.52.B9]|nr:hypothetical protein BCU91_16510 [Shewanella sp. 10N.286.52.B9]